MSASTKSLSVDREEVCLARTQLAYQKICQRIRQAHLNCEPIDNLERDLVTEVMSLGHAALGDFIEAAGDGDVGEETTRAGQVLRRSERKHKRTYRSVFGNIQIQRYIYWRRPKTRALAKPLDQKLGLPADEVSYVLEDWLTNLSVDIPFQSVANWLKKTFAIDATATMAHRRVEKLGGYVEEFNEQRQGISPQQDGDILVVLADGKGVPIRHSFEQRAHEKLGIPLQRRVASQKDYPKSEHRHVLGDRKTQRATAGAFYSINQHNRTATDVLQGKSQPDVKVKGKRLWAEMNLIGEEEISRGSQRVFESLAQEYRQRDPKKRKTLVCLMDGDRHLWALQKEYLPGAIEILDLFHVIERLWLAAQCFHQEASLEAEAWVQRHLSMLLEDKVDCVRGLLTRAIKSGNLSKTKRGHLRSVHRYFSVNRDRMWYGSYLSSGFPIGSGVIEGACKHVIADRMCGAGMSWEYEGAQPMLDLRVTKLNDEWEQLVDYRIAKERKELYATAA